MILLILNVLLAALPDLSAEITAPDCSVRMDQIGPAEVRSGGPGTLLLKVENPAGCEDTEVVLSLEMPNSTRYRRAFPAPLTVEKRPSPLGPRLTWEKELLGGGQVSLAEVSVAFMAFPNQWLTSNVCVQTLEPGGQRRCRAFQIRILP